MKILVTGGAGYIGSHTVAELIKQGHEVVVFDNLVYGHKEAVACPLVFGDLLRKDEINSVFEKVKFDSVIHFAAYIEVGESVINPQKYFINNVVGTLNLLEVMIANKVFKIVFSSTAAVYGESESISIDEDDPKFPSNPYGESKLMVEKVLSWYHKAYGLSAIALRYFNAAGASLDGSLGQDYPKPTHLITRACEAALGKRTDFKIYGNDYNTPDGTCIRDYVHVLDLADAHLKSLEFLGSRQRVCDVFNVGTGKGYSVLEVVEMVRQVARVQFEAPFTARREGDVAKLIAKTDKIKKVLGWEPKYSDLETIVKTAWSWHKTHPSGFASKE